MPEQTPTHLPGKTRGRVPPGGLALTLLLALIVLASMLPLPARAQEPLVVEYVTRVYITITDYYYGRQVEEHFFKVTLLPTSEGYQVASIDFAGLRASIFNAQSLMRALTFPGEWHYSLPPTIVQQAARDRDVAFTGAELIYVGRDAVTLPNGGMEDGVLVILSTPQGGKRVLYDDDTGILLREYFIVRGSLGQRSVVVTQVHQAPPVIGDENVSGTGTVILQTASAVITLAALGVVARRGRYRIL